MIDSLVNWAENALESKTPDRLYTFFFRLYEILTAISVLYVFSAVRTLLVDAPLGISFGALIFESVIWTGLFILLAELGLRFVRRANIIGFWIGLALSFQLLFSMKFLVGLFGFYVFLNPASQKQLLGSAPDWLKQVLTELKINFTQSP